jgi:hypothetical protein
MEALGYVVVRSAGSRTPVDIYAFDIESKVFIQCKTNGVLRPDEWNKFYGLCKSVEAIPVLAMRNARGRGIVYKLLTGYKEPHRRQPMVDWIPMEGERHEVPTFEG